MTSMLAPLIVGGFIVGAFLVMVGATKLGKKLIVGSLVLGAVVPTLLSLVISFLRAAVPVIEVGFAILVAVGVVVAGARFANHKRKLSEGAPKLSVKRRIEGD